MKLSNVGRHMAVGTFLIAALLLDSGRALAQNRNVEVSGGYSFLHEGGSDGEDGLSYPAGWYASGGGYLNDWLGIVGEVNGHYKTVSQFGVDVETSIHIFGVGPKFAFRRDSRVTPYVQALFGGGRVSVSALGFDEALNGFSYQPSAGLEINNSSGSVGFRVAIARAAIRSEGEWFGETMFMAGVVIRR